MRAEGARTERRRDGTVDPAGHADNRALSAERVPNDVSGTCCDRLCDLLRIDVERLCSERHGVVQQSRRTLPRHEPTMFSIESRFSGISSSSAILISNCSSRNPMSSRMPVESRIPASISEFDRNARGFVTEEEDVGERATDLIFHDVVVRRASGVSEQSAESWEVVADSHLRSRRRSQSS